MQQFCKALLGRAVRKLLQEKLFTSIKKSGSADKGPTI